MEYLVAFPQHRRLSSRSAVRCSCAGSAIRTRHLSSNSWPHLSQGMMQVLFSPLFTATLSLWLLRLTSVNTTFIILYLQDNYDEEIEAYKHHLEQTYKLCKPCQTAVEYYIKFQNRHLRTVLLNHPLRRSGETDKGFVKVSAIKRCINMDQSKA